MMPRLIFFSILLIDAIVLFTQTSELSISYHEAQLLYGKFSFLQILIKTSIYFLGQNDFALRVPMMLMHLISVVLLYDISKKYIKENRDRLWLILIFVLLPGVISSSLVVNSAGLVIFGLLLFVYVNEHFSEKIVYLLLLFYSLIDAGFIYLFLGLAIFYLYNKKKYNSLLNFFLFGLSIYLYGFEAKGAPTGHFLDSIGIYSAIFTPIIFIYLFYTLYRRYLTNKIDLLWYISSVALVFSLLLSFRQRVAIEHFAPYLMLGLPLAAQTFISSYRVRLKMFRTSYKIIFVVSFAFLILNALVVLFNKELYLVMENPKKHFVYKMHVVKELAYQLKSQDINCITTDKENQLRLKFYGISTCDKYVLIENKLRDKKDSNVTISYKNKILYSATVTKLNNK